MKIHMPILQGAALELSADSTGAILSTQSPSLIFPGKAIQSPGKHSLKGKRTGQPHHRENVHLPRGEECKEKRSPNKLLSVLKGPSNYYKNIEDQELIIYVLMGCSQVLIPSGSQ